MSVQYRNGVPLEFGDHPHDRKHTVMFYSDEKYKNRVQGQFIKNGLLKDEHCIYFVHESTKNIKKQLSFFGIDVDDFLKKGLLHIYKIPDISNEPEDVLTTFISMMKKCISDSKPPYKITGRFIPDISTQKGINAELKIERFLHANFDNFNCDCLCTYGMEEFSSSTLHRTKDIIQSHHTVIHAIEDSTVSNLLER